MKRKVGRPKKVNYDQVTMSQLALNQVEYANKMSQIATTINSFARTISDIVEGVNEGTFKLNNKLQAIEIRCDDLEKRLTSLTSKEPSHIEDKKEFN